MKENDKLEINPSAGLEEAIKDANATDRPVPTPEEVKEAEAAFKQTLEEWEKVTFELSPGAKVGQNFIDYIKEYMNSKMMWTQNAWMGAIKLEEELIASEVVYHNGNKKKAPIIGYQALEFIIYILNNPGGVGLQSAKNFETGAEQHVVVLEYLERQLESAHKSLDHIKFLQEKWAAYEQGYYYEKEPTDEEMPEGSYYDETQEKFLKPGDKGYDIHKFIEAVEKQYGKKTADQVKADMDAATSDTSEDKGIGPEIDVEFIKVK